MFRYKEYVYAVYKERNFSRAAKKLHTSQPWLSSKIRECEDRLGVQLFDRSTSPIRPTEAGLYYVKEIEKILAIEEEVKQHFSELQRAERETLHIGSSMFFCTYVLPTLLKDFHAEHPQVTMMFSEGNTGELFEKLRKGELDLVLEVEKPQFKQINSIPWTPEEVVLAVPARYHINEDLAEYCYTFDELLKCDMPGGKRKPPVPLERFKDEPFLLLNEENDINRRGMALCRNAGFSPEIKLLLSQMMTAYYLVCEGRGVAFLRSTIAEYVTPTDSVVFYQLGDPLAQREIYLSYAGRRVKPICRQLIQYLEEKREPDPSETIGK